MDTLANDGVQKASGMWKLPGRLKTKEGDVMVAALLALGCRLTMEFGDTAVLTTADGQLIYINFYTSHFTRSYNGRVLARGTGLYALRSL